MHRLRVNLGERSYDIVISTSHLGNSAELARERCHGRLAIVVTDGNVVSHAEKVQQALQSTGFATELITLPAGENQKCLTRAAQLYDVLAQLHADRQTLVTAVGGGVIGDLAGFVAATFSRGLPLFMVPTTLLAMVDSSVGGKVGINHPRGKNLIGAFHQPVGVWIDTATLDTLPDREFHSGLAEVVKYGVILDGDFFAWQEQHAAAILKRRPETIRHVIEQCCRLKAQIVEQDEREEKNLRVVLNYGHTFAHAFETVLGYGTWLHGEAVAAGMICASQLAERRGLIGPEVTERQHRLLTTFHLPVAPPERMPIDELLTVMHSDKKAAAGKLRFVLPRRLGEVALFNDVPDEEVVAVMRGLTE
jgi:3-dehydroquinate synthase